MLACQVTSIRICGNKSLSIDLSFKNTVSRQGNSDFESISCLAALSINIYHRREFIMNDSICRTTYFSAQINNKLTRSCKSWMTSKNWIWRAVAPIRIRWLITFRHVATQQLNYLLIKLSAKTDSKLQFCYIKFFAQSKIHLWFCFETGNFNRTMRLFLGVLFAGKSKLLIVCIVA